jgi:hypothetical protein
MNKNLKKFSSFFNFSGSSPSNCPLNTRPIGRSCTTDQECTYLYGSQYVSGRCYVGVCCTSSYSGTDPCSQYGGVFTGERCTTSNSNLCRSLTAASVQCVNGYCCSVQYNPGGGGLGKELGEWMEKEVVLAYCYDGRQATRRCQRTTDCQQQETCMNGLCCATTGNEWKCE